MIIPLRGDEVRRPGRKARPPTVLNLIGRCGEMSGSSDPSAVAGIASMWKSGLPDPLWPVS